VRAQTRLAHLTDELGERPQGDGEAFDLERLEWFDLRNMLLVARTVTEAALARRESRGSHRREDFPAIDPAWAQNQIARLKNERIVLSAAPVDTLKTAAQ
jgi:succinate dehydrogenase/fumarate reductase flavoprotein subunit